MGGLFDRFLPKDVSYAFSLTVAQIKKRIPMAQKHLEKIKDLFQRYDTDKDDSLNLNELALLLQEISSKISPLPAVSHTFKHFFSLSMAHDESKRPHKLQNNRGSTLGASSANSRVKKRYSLRTAFPRRMRR